MPHECTACGRTFPDGSKKMLSGCPDCGGTKFQFQPPDPDADAGRRMSDPDAPAASDPPPESTSVTGRAWPTYGDEPSDERRVRGRVDSRARSPTATDETPAEGPESTPRPSDDGDVEDDGIVVADEEPLPADAEDDAQADARSGFAAADEVAAGAATDDETAADDAESAPDDEASADLSALRKELNDQFESIRIVSPGQYELNLMELYEREEHIISLREDGRYVIEVPETWRNG